MLWKILKNFRFLSGSKQGLDQVICRPKKIKKTFQDSPSHQILLYMYEILNIDENKKLIAQFVCKSRDEYFEPS